MITSVRLLRVSQPIVAVEVDAFSHSAKAFWSTRTRCSSSRRRNSCSSSSIAPPIGEATRALAQGRSTLEAEAVRQARQDAAPTQARNPERDHTRALEQPARGPRQPDPPDLAPQLRLPHGRAPDRAHLPLLRADHDRTTHLNGRRPQKKRQMIELLDERDESLFSAALESRGFQWSSSLDHPAADLRVPFGWQVAHLSVVLDQLTNGYVGPTRDLLVAEGVRYIQSLHIKRGRIDFNRHPFYVPVAWHEERPRIHLRPSDVLIVQTGDIGQIAVVPQNFGSASCHALQIARVRKDILSGEYLGAYLRSPFGRQSLLSRATGALHPHLEGGIKDVPVVLPPMPVQHGIVEEIAARRAKIGDARSTLLRQIDLLAEHRQTLITAAVTGDLDLSEAA